MNKFISYNPATKDGLRWIENVSAGLRFHKFADEISRHINHTGWFIDNNQDEKLRGAVYLLPHGKYLAGYADAYNNDCARIDFTTIHNDELSAALAADGIAENTARDERDYNEAWRAGYDYREAGEELTDARKAALELIHDVKSQRANGAPDSICKALRHSIQKMVKNVSKLQKKRAKLLHDAPRWNADLLAAFNDGKGE